MDIINNEKKYPQLVEVVNPSGTVQNPTNVEVLNLPLTSNNEAFRVSVINTNFNNKPTTGSSYNIQLDNILLLKADGTFVPIPLNSTFTNLTNAQITFGLESYKLAYETLVSSMASATLHYSKFTAAGVVTSEVYNLKD